MGIGGKFKFIDIVVLVVFISTAFLGLYLFREDFMRTLEARDAEPAGIIIIRNNIVQRRHEDRVLWDRLFVDSPVYPGDLIRVAEVSSTTIDLDKNEIFLNENTLIRIQSNLEGARNFQVELREGNISVASGAESSGILLNLFGSIVQTVSGTVLDASADEEGVILQVSEGAAEFIQEGESREITVGSMVALDTQGTERMIPSVVVTRPSNNARFLKSGADPYLLNFAWNRINLLQEDLLRLEIAGDSGFSQILFGLNGLYDSAQIAFTEGQWFWRIMFEDRTIRRGSFTVFDSSGPALVSPVINTVFRHAGIPPQVRFQWEQKRGASNYLVEVSESPDFNNLEVSRMTAGVSLIVSDLASGEWFWRVKPVFGFSGDGKAAYSPVSSFRIERSENIAAPAIEIPASSVERARAASALVSPPAPTAAQTVSQPRQEAVTVTRPQPSRTVASVFRQRYTVRPGDTLGRIAFRFYGDFLAWDRIAAANNIENPDLIHSGQVFIIP